MTVPMILPWALPLAYGVEGYALKKSIAIKTKATIAIQEKTFLKMYMLFTFLGIIEYQLRFCPCCTK
jgi:hypothetical protein